MTDLSVIITARNEEFLERTVADVLAKKRADTEVIVILDGGWAHPELIQRPDLTVIYHKESVGQRAAINEGAKLSKAKYIMKLDAHCVLDEGFDTKLIKDAKPNWVVVPIQFNLHAFDWKCKKCGNRWYQGPTPKHCQNNGEGAGENKNCDSTEFERVMVWKPRAGRKTEGWVFDKDLHFQYDGGIAKRQSGQLIETMSLIGACFFMERDWYWKIGGSEESWGSWGQQGTEISSKTWLLGGKVIVNRNTWFAHLFRTQGGDFGFPYPQSGRQVEGARKKSKEYFREGKWKGIYPLHWLVERFWPVRGWSEDDLRAIGGTIPGENTKGIIYYTDNKLNLRIAHAVQKQLKSIGFPIVSSSLKPMNLGKNVVTHAKRGYLTMFKQILSALETLHTKYVFFCEHDVLYHPSHFNFTPPKDDVWYYNVNIWKVSSNDGHAIKTDNCKQVSGICVNRETAIKHYRERIKRLEEYKGDNFNSYVRAMGFEPGTHHREERIDNATSETWMSEYPNIDIRHEGNLTPTRWKPEQFRNQKYTEGWKECHLYDIPGWNKDQFSFLKLPE